MKGDSSSPPSRKVLGPGNCISWWRDQGHGGRRLRQGGLGPPCRRWDRVGQGPGTRPPRGWSTQATRPGSGDLHSALTRSLESSWQVTFFASCAQSSVRRRPVPALPPVLKGHFLLHQGLSVVLCSHFLLVWDTFPLGSPSGLCLPAPSWEAVGPHVSNKGYLQEMLDNLGHTFTSPCRTPF